MPAAQRRAVKRTPRQPEKANPRADSFLIRLREFLSNKAMVEQLTERNQGNKKDDVPGLRDGLLAEVKARGEEDPETGSFFYDLPEPVVVDITGERVKRLKAERRVSKSLDADKTRELLEELGLLDKVEEFEYVLRLNTEQANLFGEWLKETGMIERCQSTNAVLVEDNLLQVHYGRDPQTAGPLHGKDKKPFIDDATLDGLYTATESWAFKPLTK